MDNSTVWQADYNPAHFQQLYFGTGTGDESLKTYYETQSSGRYSVDGEVTDWVKVQYNEARYGRSNGYPCGAHRLQQHLGAGPATPRTSGSPTRRPPAAPTRRSPPTCESFDQWDRYDFDGDGNFNEPDGYIDHFQIVHAGGDQADGDPQQGEDAIWSHRWYAYVTDARPHRPGRATCSAAPRSATPASGSATTPSSRRTAACSVFVPRVRPRPRPAGRLRHRPAGDNNNEHWT